MEPSEEEIKRWASPDWRDPGQMSKDPNFRIGQLEGAIKGVILHLESLDPILSARSTWSIAYKVEENDQVIANLKSLIGETE